MLSLGIELEELKKEANTLAELNDLIYACQLTYEEVTKKPKKEMNWKEAIKKKIDKFSQQLQIVTSHKQNEAPSEALKRICKTKQYHSNNEDQLKKLEDQIEEKRAVFQEKTGHCGKPDRVSENEQAVRVQSVRLLLET
ncbi:unnamed protein product [Ixodes pacificus]